MPLPLPLPFIEVLALGGIGVPLLGTPVTFLVALTVFFIGRDPMIVVAPLLALINS
jgi:hypothetical protein